MFKKLKRAYNALPMNRILAGLLRKWLDKREKP